MILDLGSREDAIVAALKADAQLAAIVGWIGAASDIAEARGAAAAIKYPWIAVVYVGGPLRPRGMATFVQEVRFQVTCASRSMRPAPGERGRKGDTGAYALVEHVLRILSGRTLAGFDELRPTDISPVEGESEGEVRYGIAFSGDAELAVEEADLAASDATPIADLVEAQVEHAVRTPADTNASIVTDTLELT